VTETFRAALDDVDLVPVAAIAAATVPWLLALLVVHLLRQPAEPAPGRPTLDLGPEPPAVVNFLVHDFRPTRAAVPATLLDLAARGFVEFEHRGPETYVCRLKAGPVEPLADYERRVLAHLQRRASGRIVPAEAMTTGPEEESKRWWNGFKNEVVTDAKRRGLSRDLLDKRAFLAVAALAAVPSVLAGLLYEAEVGYVYAFAAGAALHAVRMRHLQRETPAGLEAASRWLGVREKLAENEVFGTQSPIAVELWDRHLAYGVALGAAAGTTRQIPMGAESDRDAWSSYGGRWRPVRVKYGRFLTPGWGKNPLQVALVALAPAVLSAFVLWVFGPPLAEARNDATGLVFWIVTAILLVPAFVLAGAAFVILRAVSDLWSVRELTGQIIRLRTFGSKSDPTKQGHHIAVDGGTSSTIRAWRVRPHLIAGLNQYDVVRVSVTPRLGYVRSVTRLETTRDALDLPEHASTV
jgi:hypothetical protein